MNREIKFRFWDKDSKKMFGWYDFGRGMFEEVMNDDIIGNEKCAILCVNCFAIRAEKKFDVGCWQLLPTYIIRKNK